MLLFHGNAGDRSHRLGWMSLLREGLGVSVTVLDYRGYGGSEGTPSESGLLADGVAAAKWLVSARGRHDASGGGAAAGGAAAGGGRRRLVLWGESIGSGVAIALASDDAEGGARLSPSERPDAVVIEAGLTSCLEIAAGAYPWLPIRSRAMRWVEHGWVALEPVGGYCRGVHLQLSRP